MAWTFTFRLLIQRIEQRAMSNCSQTEMSVPFRPTTVHVDVAQLLDKFSGCIDDSFVGVVGNVFRLGQLNHRRIDACNADES